MSDRGCLPGWRPSLAPQNRAIRRVIWPRSSRSSSVALAAHPTLALLSVLGRPHPQLLRAWRDKRDGCDCGRGAYQRAYRRTWLGGG
jgi:hypothetical protein